MGASVFRIYDIGVLNQVKDGSFTELFPLQNSGILEKKTNTLWELLMPRHEKKKQRASSSIYSRHVIVFL